MKVNSLVGWTVAELCLPVGVKVVTHELKHVPNAVSVVVDSNGTITHSFPGQLTIVEQNTDLDMQAGCEAK